MAFLFLFCEAGAAQTEWPFATAETSQLAPGRKSSPAIASDGHDYLIAWTGNQGLCAARMSATGEPLDRQPLVLASSGMPGDPFSGGMPSVAWNGSDYIVAWQNLIAAEVHAARVSPAGELKDSRVIARYGQQSGSNGDVTVSAASNVVLIAWQKASTVAAMILDANLDAVAGEIPLASTSSHLASASDGHQFLVVWNNGGAVVETNGHLTPIALPAGVSATNVFFHERSWLVAYEQPQYWSWTIGRVSSDGAVTAVTTQPLPWNGSSFSMRLVARGSRLVTYFKTYSGLLVAYSTDLQTNQTSDVFNVRSDLIGTDTGGFAVDSTASAMAWIRGAQTYEESDDVRGALLGDDLLPISEGRSFSRTPHQQSAGAVTWDGSGWFAAWNVGMSGMDARNVMHLYAGKLSPTGKAVSGDGILVASDVNFLGPGVASNGRSTLVVWQQRIAGRSKILGQRFSPAVLPLDGAPFVIDDSPDPSSAMIPATQPAVASDGEDWLVVWETGAGGGGVAARRIRSSGVADATVTLATGGKHGSPAVAYAAGVYWATWLRYTAVPCPLTGIPCLSPYLVGDPYAGRISASGQPLDPIGGIALGSDLTLSKWGLAVAANSEGALVVWHSRVVVGPGQVSVRSAALRSDGSVMVTQKNGVEIGKAGVTLYLTGGTTSTAWTGSSYLVLWTAFQPGSTEVHRADLDRTGGVVAGDRIIDRIAAPVSISHSLSCVSGRCFDAYSRWAQERPYAGVTRLFLRPVDLFSGRVRAARK